MELEPPPAAPTNDEALSNIRLAALNVLVAARLLESFAQQTDALPSVITDTTKGLSRSLNDSAEMLREALSVLAGGQPEEIAPPVPNLAVKLGNDEAAALTRSTTRSKRRLSKRGRAALAGLSRAEGRS